MPIEIEDKFVLVNNDLERILRQDIKKYQCTIYEIHQAYIGSEGRIRKRRRTHHKGKTFKKPRIDYIFTYKRGLRNQKGSLELEMKMSQSDFEIAWREERTVSLTKTRICLYMPYDEMWEVDFFKQDNSTYFVLAECELQLTSSQPQMMPDILKQNLLYEVPDKDSRFKNRNLADKLKAEKLLNDLSTEIIRGKTLQQDATLPLQGVLSR